MLSCDGMCRTVYLGLWSVLTAVRWMVPTFGGSAGVTVAARTALGEVLEPGADF
jgi:hypothetical protein